MYQAIVLYSLFKIVRSTNTMFETQSDMMIKPEFISKEVGTLSLLQCATVCGWDKLCMSASHSESGGICKFSLYRIKGPENQHRLANGSSWTSLTKIGYLDGWTLIGETYYLFYYGYKAYNQAKAYCVEQGGKLAEPQTNSTNQLLKNYISGLDGFFWFGLNDIPTEGQYVWDSTGETPSYSNWKEGHPIAGLPDCCLYDPSGEWNIFACHSLSYSVCELA